jgi:NAD(P)H-dependent FMN reductase
MKNVLAFAGSNSKNSINKQLASFVVETVSNCNSVILDLNDFDLPLYGIDYEKENGIPDNAHKFLNHIKASDGIVLSLAEHNGAYAAVFKNIFDWMSRIDGNIWSNKPMLLMATSPGGRGGKSVLDIAEGKFPRMSANIVGVFSLPFFSKNFSAKGIADSDLNNELHEKIKIFEESI